MMTHTLLRGGYYDTLSTKKCYMFHPCLLTKKCQNYDPNRRQCFLCEQRVKMDGKPVKNLKGIVPEGANRSDPQHALRVIEDFLKQPFASPDRVANAVPVQGVEQQARDYRNAVEIMSRYTNVVEE